MVWKPRVTVAAIAENEGRFLMVEEEIGGEQKFNQPAGHLEDGESLCAAVSRECLEETGWQFVPGSLVGLYRWRHPASGDTYLRATFAGACADHDPNRALDDDITAIHWLSVEEIRQRHEQLRSPLVIRSIDDYLAGLRYPLELLVDIDGR